MIFGNDGADHIYGRAGHDAQSGGAGADEFHDVDAADLDGTHTLDGTHSIDGGDGIDTVDLGGLKTLRLRPSRENREHGGAELQGRPGGRPGDAGDAELRCRLWHHPGRRHPSPTITGDAGKDTVNLVAGSGKTWSSDGEVLGFQLFHAGSGADKVTVSVEHGVNVDLS